MPKKYNEPWITEDGHLDLAKFPIDSILTQAVGGDQEKFDSACRLLGAMVHAERTEAEVFLFGLLTFCADDLAKKRSVAEALGEAKTRQAAELLFGELERTPSSNATRKYIDAVLRSLRRFPLNLVGGRFRRMIADRKWSYKMKQKFEDTLEEVEYRDRRKQGL
jgi:hypothetical protein